MSYTKHTATVPVRMGDFLHIEDLAERKRTYHAEYARVRREMLATRAIQIRQNFAVNRAPTPPQSIAAPAVTKVATTMATGFSVKAPTPFTKG